MNRSNRELLAELEILTTYDAIRQSRGHDYGGGQRAAELRRRRQSVEPNLGEPLTVDELADAYDRVGRPRLERLERDAFGTASSNRSIAAWRTVAKLRSRSSSGASAAAESSSQRSEGPQPAGNGRTPLSASRLESGRWRASCSRCTYSAERSKREPAEHALAVHLAYVHEVSS